MNSTSFIQIAVAAVAFFVSSAPGGTCDQTGRHHATVARRQAAASNRHALNERLLAAVNAGRSAQVRVLLAQGADPNVRYGWHGHDSATVLMGAAALGQFPIVQTLLSRRADVNARGYTCMTARPDGDFRDSTALIEACLRSGNEDVVDALLARGADVNAKDRSGGTALSAAVWQAQWAEAETLLRHGARAGKATRREIARRLYAEDLAH